MLPAAVLGPPTPLATAISMAPWLPWPMPSGQAFLPLHLKPPQKAAIHLLSLFSVSCFPTRCPQSLETLALLPSRTGIVSAPGSSAVVTPPSAVSSVAVAAAAQVCLRAK